MGSDDDIYCTELLLELSRKFKTPGQGSNNCELDKEVRESIRGELHSTQTEEFPASCSLGRTSRGAIIHPLTPFLANLHLRFSKVALRCKEICSILGQKLKIQFLLMFNLQNSLAVTIWRLLVTS